jgi:hypothetical protein
MSIDPTGAVGRDFSVQLPDSFDDQPPMIDRADFAQRAIEAGNFSTDPVQIARADIRDGKIAITPDKNLMQDLPTATLPNNVGAAGFSPGIFSHDYLVVNRAPSELRGREGLDAVGKALLENPTPGKDTAASGNGSRNDVGPLDPTGLIDGGTNFVNSYSVKSTDPTSRSDMVVNYTIKGEHMLHEGFVMRYGRLNNDGSIDLITYGEGNALYQVEALEGALWGDQVKQVWTDNANEIFDRARNP